MATDVTTPDAVGNASPQPAVRKSRPHEVRFGLIYGGLAVIFALAIAGVVVFASRSIHPPPKWSAWKPHGGGLGAAQEIADHVARSYRLPNGQQLVDVIPKAPSVSAQNTTAPIHYVAIHPNGTNGAHDQIYPVSSTNGVMFELCGLGPSCSIASGTPSQERGRLVRREILELALYTFKYESSIQSVIAFIPPRPPAAGKQTTAFVVYLRRSDMQQELKRPLASTLGSHVPLPKTIPATEVRVIDETTNPRVYAFNGVAQAPAGDLVFVLVPIPTA